MNSKMLTNKDVIISWKENAEWNLCRNNIITIWINKVWVIPIMLIEDKKELKIVLIITVYKIKESLLSFISKYWVIKMKLINFLHNYLIIQIS